MYNVAMAIITTNKLWIEFGILISKLANITVNIKWTEINANFCIWITFMWLFSSFEMKGNDILHF